MIIHPAQQGSLEWLTARAGVITASEMDNILTPEFKARSGDMVKSYLYRKLAERWMGSPLAGFQSWDMSQGEALEDECLPLYELESGQTVERVGLIYKDESMLVGASPDGLLGEDGGVEAKCCRCDTHLKYLLGGVVPKEYTVQVHACLYVTGRKYWKFLSYHRRAPLLVVHVERDEEIQEKIDAALEDFIAGFNVQWNKLCDLNGGPPKHQTAKQAAQKQEPEAMDVVP